MDPWGADVILANCSQSAPQIPFPLLITGTAGVAGYNAFRFFHDLFPRQVIGIRPRNNWRLSGPGLVALDAEDLPGLQKLFDRWQFRSVLNCAGNCALKSCELDPQMAWRTNVASAQNLVAVVGSRAVRVIHLSVDLVFSGARPGGYTEDDVPDPVTVYGQTMVEAERALMSRLPQACVLRISLPMGVSFNGHAGAIDWIQSRFKKQQPATLYFDEVRTPTYCACLNELFLSLLTTELDGLYHAGGPRALSLYQIAQIVNRAGGYKPELLMGCPRAEAGPLPPRAGNVSLDCRKLIAALGTNPFHGWPVRETLVPDALDWHYRREESGSRDFLACELSHNPQRAKPSPSP